MYSVEGEPDKPSCGTNGPSNHTAPSLLSLAWYSIWYSSDNGFSITPFHRSHRILIHVSPLATNPGAVSSRGSTAQQENKTHIVILVIVIVILVIRLLLKDLICTTMSLHIRIKVVLSHGPKANDQKAWQMQYQKSVFCR